MSHVLNNKWLKLMSLSNLSLAALLLFKVFQCHAGNVQDAVCDNTSASEKMSCLQDQVRRSPADARTWFDLGKYYHEVGDIAMAKRSYHNVIKLYPVSYLAAEAHLHQGIIHQTDGAVPKWSIQQQFKFVAPKSSLCRYMY